MIKKILAWGVALLSAAAFAAAAYWHFNGDRLRAEYKEYRRTAAPILMYHAVGQRGDIEWPGSLIISEQLFEAHLRYLKDAGYNIVTVERLAQRLERGESVEGYIGMTFDDGYKNNYEVALPLLRKYDAKASFFVVNQFIGGKIHMDRREIKELIAAGMELGSHTTSHAPLTRIDEKYLAWELATSRYYLKTDFDRYVVRTLAYPNGGYNDKVIAAAQKYGFYRAVTGHVGVNSAATYKKAPMEMYRVTVADDGNGIDGLQRRIEEAYIFGFLQTKGWDINIVRDIFVR